MLTLYPLSPGVEPISSTILPNNSFSIELLPPDNQNDTNRGKYVGTIIKNKRLTKLDHFQDIRDIQISISSQHFSYNPGDSLVIYPKNLPEKVNQVLEYLGWEEIADNMIQISCAEENEIPFELKTKMTLRKLFLNHLDIFGKPRRYFFHLLSFFATNEQHREKLVEFSSAEGQNDLYAYSHKTRRNYFEVLQDFSSVRIPLKYLLDLIPLMRPRYFSISSAFAIDQNKLDLTVAVVKYRTSLKEPRLGVCTSWLASLKAGGIY